MERSMRDSGWLSEEDLARSHSDPAFRHQLLAESLDRLITEISKLRNADTASDPVKIRQIREGARLCVQLADLLQNIADDNKGPSSAG
jgi:hypothetical protein